MKLNKYKLRLTKSANHNLLHKIGKHWIVISFSVITLLLGTSALSVIAHADTTLSQPITVKFVKKDLTNNNNQRTSSDINATKSQPINYNRKIFRLGSNNNDRKLMNILTGRSEGPLPNWLRYDQNQILSGVIDNLTDYKNHRKQYNNKPLPKYLMNSEKMLDGAQAQDAKYIRIHNFSNMTQTPKWLRLHEKMFRKAKSLGLDNIVPIGKKHVHINKRHGRSKANRKHRAHKTKFSHNAKRIRHSTYAHRHHKTNQHRRKYNKHHIRRYNRHTYTKAKHYRRLHSKKRNSRRRHQQRRRKAPSITITINTPSTNTKRHSHKKQLTHSKRLKITHRVASKFKAHRKAKEERRKKQNLLNTLRKEGNDYANPQINVKPINTENDIDNRTNMANANDSSATAERLNVYYKGRNDATKLLKYMNIHNLSENSDEENNLSQQTLFNDPDYRNGFIAGAETCGVSQGEAKNIVIAYKAHDNSSSPAFNDGWNNGLYDNNSYDASHEGDNNDDFNRGWYLGNLVDNGGSITDTNHAFGSLEFKEGHPVKAVEDVMNNASNNI